MNRTMRVALGIDIGTTSICVLAVDAESSAPVNVLSVANDFEVPTAPERSEQDPLRIRDSVLSLLEKTRSLFALLPSN